MPVDLMAKAAAKVSEAEWEIVQLEERIAQLRCEAAKWNDFLNQARVLASDEDGASLHNGEHQANSLAVPTEPLKPAVGRGTLAAKIAALLHDGDQLTVSEIADALIRTGRMVEGQHDKVLVRNALKRRGDVFIEAEEKGRWKLRTTEYVEIG